MDQATNEPLRRRPHGGDTHTPQAKADTARREQQIVALRLRGVPFHEIGRVIGIGRVSAFRAFKKALRRNTDQDIQTHHRMELAELEMEKANVWRAMDANKENWQAQMAGTSQLRGIHIRRAHLLGLDAPTKLDVSGIYQRGGSDLEAEQQAREAVIEALPIEERLLLPFTTVTQFGLNLSGDQRFAGICVRMTAISYRRCRRGPSGSATRDRTLARRRFRTRKTGRTCARRRSIRQAAPAPYASRARAGATLGPD